MFVLYFYIWTLFPATWLNSFIHPILLCRFFSVFFVDFYIICMPFLFFDVLEGASSTNLNKSGKKRHSCLPLNLRGGISNLSSLKLANFLLWLGTEFCQILSLHILRWYIQMCSDTTHVFLESIIPFIMLQGKPQGSWGLWGNTPTPQTFIRDTHTQK